MALLLTIDAFTSRPFGGNPAAVCLLDEARPDAWMQDVAREMNLSETAFVVPAESGFRLRWFTPATEVSLCGHATLASAHALWETGRLSPDAEARFETRSGELTARRRSDRIEMDFPALRVAPAELPETARRALGASPRSVHRTRSAADPNFLVELGSVTEVRECAPDFPALRDLPAGIIVTAAGESGEHDFVSRYFAAHYGIDEDPVTGSAHCSLAPYWAERLGRSELVGYQASRRGGVVGCSLSGERVRLLGRAVTVLRGDLVA